MKEFTKIKTPLPLSIALSLLLLTGCENSNLSQDNPFNNPTKTYDKITILTCHGYLFELPEHVQVSQLPHWPQSPDLLPKKHDPAIDQMTLDLWTKNGLKISGAPLTLWSQLGTELIQAGAKNLYENQFWLRNPREVAEFDTTWPEKQTSIFITDQNNQLHGYSADAGTGYFRFNASPILKFEKGKYLRFHILPIFRSENEKQIIVFKQLLLGGTMAPDSFIAITLSKKSEAIGNLGRNFLVNQQQGNSQRILLLVPKSIQAKRTASPDKSI
jgi:hypothetical protein